MKNRLALPLFVKSLLLVPALIAALCLLPPWANGQVGDIILFLRQIETTLQDGIGAVLGEMKSVENTINTIHESLVWPVAAINQAKGFIHATANHYQSLFGQIRTLAVNSATLADPRSLESSYRGAAPSGFANIQTAYTQVYSAVPPAANAQIADRNMIDMDDASAVASLKAASISDKTSDATAALADSIEMQASSAAPGSAPILATQAQIANLESQAQQQKLWAAELRLEAARLAHDNALLKRSAEHKAVLQQQVQQTGSGPNQ